MMKKTKCQLATVLAFSVVVSFSCLQANAAMKSSSPMHNAPSPGMSPSMPMMRMKSSMPMNMSSMQTMPIMYNRANSWILQGGAAMVNPTNNSGYTRGIIPGEKIKADNNTQLGISLTYMVTNHFGIELLAASPFKHSLKLSNHIKVGTTRLLPPTISAEYYFAPPDSRWQPYIGMGINYSYFYNEKLDKGLKADGFNKLKLSNSVGLAGQVGITFYIDPNWLLNASVMYANVNTTGTLTNTAGNIIKVKTNINPWIYRVNFGYRF